MPRRNDRARRHIQLEPRSHPNFDQPNEDDGPSPLPVPVGLDAARHLENLRVALRHANVGLYARLEHPIGRPPQLRVHAEGIVENLCIHVRTAAGTSSLYAWAWGLIGPATDPAGAATSVLQVLEMQGRQPSTSHEPEPTHTFFDLRGASRSRSSLSDPGSARHLDHNVLCLAAAPTAVGMARRFALAQLATWNLLDLADGCLLVVSELVTNSMKATKRLVARPGAKFPDHPAATIILRLRRTPTRLSAEVWDRCEAPPVLTAPDESAEEGRGLILVEALTTEWGFYLSVQGGKVTWGLWDLPL